MSAGAHTGPSAAGTEGPAEDARVHASDDDRAMLQRRLARVFAVLAGVSFFYGLSQLIAALVPGVAAAGYAVPLSTLAVGVGNGLLALRYRRGRRSLSELHAFDAAATVLTCWMLPLVLSRVRPLTEASISLQLGATYVLMARAVLVPSSGWRTLIIAVIALVPGAVAATSWRVGALPGTPTLGVWVVESYIVVRSLAVTTFLAALASKVIYGLRRQVSESARVGQYVLREKLGEGGMGIVYRATHAILRRDTAVKLLLPDRVQEQSIARFEREVKLMAQLTHPNTVAVFDYGRTPEGVFYYAMEYLDGADLERLVRYAGPLDPGRVIWILDQVCRALSEAHALGLIHRDIKPSNVLLCERGNEGDVAKLVDFGLVKDLNASDGVHLTQNKALTGTPLYIAPESITTPEDVDARSDVYALGAVAYFLLVGHPVFSGNTIVEVCLAHLQTPPVPPSLRRPALGPELDAVVLRCLEKQPNARYPDVNAFRLALASSAAARDWDADKAAAWWSAHRDRLRRERVEPAADTLPASSALDTEHLVRIDFGRRT